MHVTMADTYPFWPKRCKQFLQHSAKYLCIRVGIACGAPGPYTPIVTAATAWTQYAAKVLVLLLSDYDSFNLDGNARAHLARHLPACRRLQQAV